LRHCFTSRKIAGSIPDLSLQMFIHTILPAALLPCFSHKCVPAIISEGKSGRCVWLITLLHSCADCLQISECEPAGMLRASSGLYRVCFTVLSQENICLKSEICVGTVQGRLANAVCEMCIELICLGETLNVRLTDRSTGHQQTNRTVSQLLIQFHKLYATQHFTTTIKPVDAPTSRFADPFNIIIPSTPRPSNCGFTQVYYSKPCIHLACVPYMPHALPISVS